MVTTQTRTGLSATQVDFYRANGYLTIENVLTPEQLDEAHHIVGELVAKSRTVTSNDDVYVLEPGHSAETPRLARIKAPSQQHPFFDELMRSAPILDCVEALIGANIRFQGEKLNLKAAGVGSAVEWHQDFAFYPHTNDDLLAVGVALDDCTLQNGCLLVIPGSHRGPTVLDHHQDGYFIGAITPSRDEIDLSRAVPAEVKAGGISIHHAHMMHASAPNRSANPRRLLLYQYAAVDAWPLGGAPDWDAYNAKIVRGEPTVQVRMIAQTAPAPMPKPDDSGGAIFGLQAQVKETAFAGR